jgi:hypothetical protein
MTLSDLYPTLFPDELKEAERNLQRYAEIVFEIAKEADLKHAIEDRGEGK